MNRNGQDDQSPVSGVFSPLETEIHSVNNKNASAEHGALRLQLLQLSLELEFYKNELAQSNAVRHRLKGVTIEQSLVAYPNVTQLYRKIEINGTPFKPHNDSNSNNSAVRLPLYASADKTDSLRNIIQMIVRSNIAEADYQTICETQTPPSIQQNTTIHANHPHYRKTDIECCDRYAIDPKVETREYLQHLATHDELTGLPNRRFFNESLSDCMLSAQRDGYQLGIAILDLDQFKVINDTFGHDVGDEILVKTAQRLTDAVGPGNFAARLAGDEFTLIIKGFENHNKLKAIFESIRDTLSHPYQLSTATEIRVTSSIGVSVYPTDAANAKELVKCADMAMYAAKSSGRSCVEFFDHNMKLVKQRNNLLQKELRTSIENKSFESWYQPIYKCYTDSFTSVSLQPHWRHPERGLLPPDEFMKLAEDCGAIVPLGEQILKDAFKQQHQLADSGYGHITVSVNISQRQIIAEGFTEKVEEILNAQDADASQIEFVLTEKALIDADKEITDEILKLHALGIRFAIDGFGVGYFSFSHLGKLPISKIKLDHSITQGIPFDKEKLSIFNALIAMGKSLQISVVAQEVTSQAQLNYLLTAGCDEVQGSLMAESLPEITLIRFFRSENRPGNRPADEQASSSTNRHVMPTETQPVRRQCLHKAVTA